VRWPEEPKGNEKLSKDPTMRSARTTNSTTTHGSQAQPGATMNNSGSGTTGSGLNNGLNNGQPRAVRPRNGRARQQLGNSGVSGSNTGLGQTPRIANKNNPTAGTNQTGLSANSPSRVGSTMGSGC
jgi:hypothetical protein